MISSRVLGICLLSVVASLPVAAPAAHAVTPSASVRSASPPAAAQASSMSRANAVRLAKKMAKQRATTRATRLAHDRARSRAQALAVTKARSKALAAAQADAQRVSDRVGRDVSVTATGTATVTRSARATVRASALVRFGGHRQVGATASRTLTQRITYKATITVTVSGKARRKPIATSSPTPTTTPSPSPSPAPVTSPTPTPTTTTTSPSPTPTTTAPVTTVSVLAFGAVGDGTTDDTAALQRAFDATTAGTAVSLPAGMTFRHTDVLRLRNAGMKVTGSGVLLATNESRSSVWIAADDVTVEGIGLRAVNVTRRWDAFEQMKLRIAGYRGAVVRNVTIDGAAAAGLFVGDSATGFLLDHVTVRNTRADGIHMTGGSNHGRVVAPVVSASGDDGVAVVSYAADGPVCSDIVVESPTVQGTTWGRGVSVVGGTRITYRNVDISSSNAAAVYVAEEGFPFYTAASTDVSVLGGTLSNSNTNAAVDHGAIVVYNGSTKAMSGITISDLTVTDTRSSASRQSSILTDGAAVTGTTFSNIGFHNGPSTLFWTNATANTTINLFRM